MSIRKIIRAILHPTTIKIVALVCMLGLFFILPTFAQGTAQNASGLAGTQKFLNELLKVCSRGWVVLAILAGKLMTNDRVYGSIIHMDIYLRKIWNIMKNFANFALIGLVLFNIIKSLVGKDKAVDIKSIITKTLIAGILIQASRFLVGALIDVSTIATSAVGAFPSSFLKTDAKLQQQIITSITKTPKRYMVDITNLGTGSGLQPIDTGAVDATNTWEDILPTYNSVSGPLIYLGFSVFKFQNYMNIEGSAGAEQLTISFLLRVILILFYTIGLALLFIANIIRVAFLRIFVIGAPIIVLFQVFEMKGAGESAGGIGKYLKFSVMLDLIFKPVIFVAGFSMILILVVSMQSIMQGTLPKSFNGVTIGVTSGSSSLAIEGISNIEVKENNILGKDPFDTTGTQIKEAGQTIFVNLLLFFLTAFLMWQFIKMSLTTGEGPIKDIMGGDRGLIKGIERLARTLPILPLAGGTSITSADTFLSKNKEKMLGGVGLNKSGEFGELGAGGKFMTQQEKFRDWISGSTNWKDSDYAGLAKIGSGSNYTTFFTETSDLAKNRKGGLNLSSNSNYLTALQSALDTEAKAQALGFSGRLADTKEETLKTYFGSDKNKNRRALYNKLGGDEATGKSYTNANPPTRDELQAMKFYGTKATGNTEED